MEEADLVGADLVQDLIVEVQEVLGAVGLAVQAHGDTAALGQIIAMMIVIQFGQ